jgi:membrane protein involved in colicin uptake
MNKLTQLARSQQGKDLLEKAKTKANDPKTREKIDEARGKFNGHVETAKQKMAEKKADEEGTAPKYGEGGAPGDTPKYGESAEPATQPASGGQGTPAGTSGGSSEGPAYGEEGAPASDTPKYGEEDGPKAA